MYRGCSKAEDLKEEGWTGKRGADGGGPSESAPGERAGTGMVVWRGTFGDNGLVDED